MNPKYKFTSPLQTTIQLYSAVFLLIVGCGLLIAGFIINPRGEIHNSILVAFGEVLSFVGAIFGIDYSYKRKSKKDIDNNSD